MSKKTFTPEEIEWFKENYYDTNISKIRDKMGARVGRLYELADELGLERKRKRKGQYLPKGQKMLCYLDPDAPGGYCIDCIFYKITGECKKTGKDVGALWQKKCFTGEE